MGEHSQHHGQAAGVSKKGAGSFRIPREAFTVLIESRATAWQICAYLSLAQHTDASGRYTTASYKKIYDSTGASPGTEKQPGPARRLVKELMAMKSNASKDGADRLVYSPQEWTSVSGEMVPEVPNRLFPISFVLNDFQGNEWIWFPNELVAGYGRFKQPLKRLKQCGDIAARILLVAYSENNMTEFGGVTPANFIYNRYASFKHEITSHGFTFHRADEHILVVSNVTKTSVLCVKSLSSRKDVKQKQNEALNNAFISLISQGFIYEIITVMDGAIASVDSRPVYELYNKAYKVNDGEEGLARRIDRIVAKLMKADEEFYYADALGRYKKKYPVISRVGVLPTVVGIYRLRFRVSNRKNYSVKAAWSRIGNDRREWENELQFLEIIFEITHQDTNGKVEEINRICD